MRRIIKALNLSFLILVLSVSIKMFSSATEGVNESVATIGNKTISYDQMNEELKVQIFEIENQKYETQQQWLDEKILQTLLENEAQKRKLTVEQLEKKEILNKTPKVTEKQMRAFYDENKDKYKKDGKDSKPYEDIKDKIKSYLEKIAQRERRELYIADLKSKTPIMINLRKPDPPKLAVQFTDKDAFVGNSSALVTILEFTDFQCPFCVSSQETLKSIRTKYSDQVKIVTRHFPLSGHEGAKPLAIATLCANEQGKFEAYKAVVFGMRTVTNEDLILKAETLGGFNMEQFKQCLQSKKFDTQIQQDLADGQKYGVRGTPAFFVNGYPLMGAAPVEDFDELIQRALKETN